jgi:hypothetical protein
MVLQVYGLPNQVEHDMVEFMQSCIDVPYMSTPCSTQANLDVINVRLGMLFDEMELESAHYVSADTIMTIVENDKRVEGLSCLQWS